MANSVEVRVPFLDHKLVEFAFSLDDDVCLDTNTRRKLPVRHYLAQRWFSDVVSAPKRGFNLPLARLLPADRIANEVRDGYMLRDGFMQADRARDLLQRLCLGNNWMKLWLLYVLEHWYREWWVRSAPA